MPGSAAADQRWEHKVELWKHPKVGCAWFTLHRSHKHVMRARGTVQQPLSACLTQL